MAKKPISTPFDDATYKPSSGSSDFTFEGPAHFASDDFTINGQKVVIVVGEGHLPECLDNLESGKGY